MIDTPNFNQDPKDKPAYVFDPEKHKGPNDGIKDKIEDPIIQKSLDTIPNSLNNQDRILNEIRNTNDLLRQILERMDFISSSFKPNPQQQQELKED